jgi:DNA anti-recombination protein RmuC
VPEFVPTNEPEAHKRRSTRIVQAVPLTVTGVDALGRPFQERTSTLIINCHGSRYQSKHYVLKGMWVTLEVPHPEPGRPPRTVRGKVMWIQRPRTVRELFQVGVELEVSGNFWGIAFPPSDWFPFPEGLTAVPSPAPPPKPVTVPAEASWPTSAVAVLAEDNVRTLPLPAVEQAAALKSSLVPQIAQLVEDARQDLLASLRKSAAEAVSLEARPLIASLELQLRTIAESTMHSAAGAAAQSAFQEAKQGQLEAFLQESNRSLAQSVERLTQQFASRLDELEKTRDAAFEQRLENRIHDSLEQLQRQAAEIRPPAPDNAAIAAPAESGPALAMRGVQDLEQQVRSQVEQARNSLAEFESGMCLLREQSAAAFRSAQSDWGARVEADLAGAAARWNQQVESSIESAKQQLLDRLAQDTQSNWERIERELSSRLGELNKNFTDAAGGAERKLDDLRVSLIEGNERAEASLANLRSLENQLARQIEDQSARLAGLAQAAEQAFADRAAALLDAQSQEMARRAEGDIATWSERLQPALEASGQQTVARLASQIKDGLSAGIENATQVLARLESASFTAQEWLHSREEDLAKASEQAVHSAGERIKELSGILSHDLQESGRAAADKWIADIDAKATDTSHRAFESLFKTAEWYEKKTQTQMQSAIEKGLESALGDLKEKAREMSGVFGAELDHYSRSYVQHTQGQVEEVAREVVEKLRKQAEEMASASAASIVQQAREDSDAALAEFRARSTEVSAQVKTEFEAQAAAARSKGEAEGERLSAEFRAALKQHSEDELVEARRDLVAQIGSARQELRIESQIQQEKLAEYAAAFNEQALEDYKRRLESASNSWLLTTASKLSQQSEQHLQAVTRSAEQRLRDACNDVFSGVGETLRRRLVDLDPVSPPKPGE